eukprot:TRINITY_DN11257_c1_g1_i1.p1 TRINITY_DN11257_c1_g1~~TRINITY_DN11257_c1_g1_i1.p1  ORF type:complete len:109 (+),score=31.43 TRINITY_DN11257_c1_g1_i1:74-400(+)
MFISRVYCYVAVLFMYYIVLNQFFAVMEDAYVSANQGTEKLDEKDGMSQYTRDSRSPSPASSIMTMEVGYLKPEVGCLKPAGDLSVSFNDAHRETMRQRTVRAYSIAE